VGATALLLGVIGLIRLEERFVPGDTQTPKRYSWATLLRMITGNRQATLFFCYLILLLAAILGQDILLEPFGGEAFGMTVTATTRITAVWGVCFLVALLAASTLEGRLGKRNVARLGAWGALIGLVFIALSGLLTRQDVFYGGVVLLGLGSGLSTVANLSLMLDMTTALARWMGSIMGGAVRDIVTHLANNPVAGYVIVFFIEALLLFISLLLLRQVDVEAFRQQADQQTVVERASLMGEA
jgi:BCD family chlorophyll transporter-like MFS transporter